MTTPTKPDGKHDCPAPDCPQRLPRSTLACRRHWFALPAELRTVINATWRSSDAGAYLEARDEAVAYLEAHR